MAARVEVLLGDLFNVIASAVWVKRDAQGFHRGYGQHRPNLRAWFPETERAIVCEQYTAENSRAKADGLLKGQVFEPLRQYLVGERRRSGLKGKAIQDGMHRLTGKRYVFERHAFSASQWEMPTREQYEAFRSLCDQEGDPTGRPYCSREYEELRAEYEELRAEYEELRAEYEELRRPFDAEAGAYFCDTWHYVTVGAHKGKHPCEKPADMARDLVVQCSRPGGVVLDTFCGSGAFLEAAAAAGRVAWGCDMQSRWAEATRERVNGYANVVAIRKIRGPGADAAPKRPQVDLLDWLREAQ